MPIEAKLLKKFLLATILEERPLSYMSEELGLNVKELRVLFFREMQGLWLSYMERSFDVNIMLKTIVDYRADKVIWRDIINLDAKRKIKRIPLDKKKISRADIQLLPEDKRHLSVELKALELMKMKYTL
jgi:hypothetical protein